MTDKEVWLQVYLRAIEGTTVALGVPLSSVPKLSRDVADNALALYKERWPDPPKPEPGSVTPHQYPIVSTYWPTRPYSPSIGDIIDAWG